MSEKDPDQEDIMRAAFEFAAEASAEPDSSEMPTLDLGAWKPPELAAIDAMFPGYDFQRILGQGGMGAVYEAVQTSLDRKVAIKIMSPELAKIDSSFVTRFQREAKAMAQLDHPNIVTVFDFGKTEEGHCYFVMEFVDGADFHQLIQSGGLNTKSALEAVGQICDALEYAHDKDFVHRDIKPANIFINQEHRIKVGDFGLAKIVKSGEKIEVEDSSLLTQPGAFMGTPWYSAPEQLKGGKVDQRADIYSLGVMFYEMLTGEVPRGAVSPPSRRVQLDIRLDEVVLRAMADQPEARYQTVAEVRTDVDEIRTTPPVVAAPPDSEKQTRSPLGLIVVLISLIAAGAGWYFWKTSPHHELKAKLEEKFPATETAKSSLPIAPANELAIHPSEATLPAKIESINAGKGRPVLVDLLPGDDVEFTDLPLELDGVISASILSATPKNIYFVRRDGQLWLRKDTNESWFHEASFVKKVLCSYRPYAITEAGDLIRPTYDRKRWKVHASGPWIDVEPGMGFLVGINHERKLVPIPGFAAQNDDDPGKNPGLLQLPDFENATQVSLGTGTGMVMNEEGNWREWGWRNLKGLNNPDYLLKMKSVGAGGSKVLAITRDGRLVIYRNQGADEVRRQVESIRDAEALFTASGGQGAFAVRLKGNRWRLLIHKEADSLQLIDPAITDALTGCREVALTKEVAIGLRDLPEEKPLDIRTPTPRIQGRLHAWASAESDLQFDVSKAEGIDDFVQVVQFVSRSGKQVESADWAALRADGKIVSSDGRGESVENVVKLIPGAISFGAITEQGQAIYFGGGGPQNAPLEAGERAVDAAFAGSHGLAILEDRSLKYWGDKYEVANAWPEPPIEVLSAKIAHVQASGLHALAVTESGDLFVWGEDGQIDLPEQIRTGIDELDGPQMSGFAVRKGGSVWNYVITQRKLHRYNLPDGEPVARLHPQARIHHLFEGADGSFHFPVGSFEALSERLTQLPKNARHAAAAVDRFGKRVEMLLYIEPVIKGRLKAWMKTNEVPVDLSRAEGINDFVQIISVHQSWDGLESFGWAALRSDGTVVSNSGVGEDLKEVRRLLESRHSFGAILNDGSVVWYENNGREIRIQPVELGGKAVKAAVIPGSGLAILEDGSLRHWGTHYHDSNPKSWPPPPDEAFRSKIRDIGVTPEFAFALTTEGTLLVWGHKVAAFRPDEIQQGVDQAVPADNEIIAIRKKGSVFYFHIDTGEVIPFPDDLPQIKNLKLAFQGIIMEGVDGERIFRGPYDPEKSPIAPDTSISNRIAELPENEPYVVRCNHSAPVRQVYSIKAGQLRGWSRHPERTIDMSRAEGITDFIDVVFMKGDIHQNADAPFAWAALRANGEVIISHGCEQAPNDVTRLLPGLANFSVVRKDDSVHCYDPKSKTFSPTPLDGSEPVREAWIHRADFGIAILENGELRDWGRRSKPPRQVSDSQVISVAANPAFSLAVTSDGRLFGWSAEGELDVPEVLRRGINDVILIGGSGFLVRKGQVIYTYDCRLGTHRISDELEQPVRMIQKAGQVYVAEKTDGTHSLFGSQFPDLQSRLGDLKPGTPFSASAHIAGRVELLMHIQPVTPGIEPSPRVEADESISQPE